MPKYDAELIYNIIQNYKDSLKEVELGMSEDWSWTAATIFNNGEYCEDYEQQLKNGSITVCGISGSIWANPIMRVTFKSGNEYDFKVGSFEEMMSNCDFQKLLDHEPLIQMIKLTNEKLNPTPKMKDMGEVSE